MAIYIKGMEMPKVCYECKMLDDHYDYPCCIITGEQRGYNFRTRERRMDNCPLTEIPEPHGRLIDADKAIEDYANYGISHPYDAFDLKDIMDDSPTVIEGSE